MRRPAVTLGIFAVATAAFAAAVTGSLAPTAEPSALPGHLQTELDRLVAGAAVPGAQLVLTEGDAVVQVDSGVGDVGGNTAYPDNAQFRIASNTKTFVAAVVLQLAGEGRLELDAPIDRYLPGVVHGPGGDGSVITVRNLLQHTSGIPDYLGQLDLESVAGLQAARPIGELIALGMAETANFTPGSKAQYSNTNYLIAGELVRKVTGKPVGIEITTRILTPLGLTGTYWPAYPSENVIRAPHARAYHEFDGKRVDITDIDPGWGLPDGAMVSTGLDLDRYFTALLAGRVLAPAQLAEMRHTVPSNDFRRSDDFGLGLFHWKTSCGLDAWGHGGTMNGTFVYGGTTGARAVTVSLNEIPDMVGAQAHGVDLDTVVDTALCA
ncbi:serine hydrolase domain-containing protein [Nocardia inohanensis]|uniref:serine hydrolase domain-containing protein n=1 Tax=Nocardia inohanensis TaxID=209246 RepID=UPI000A06A840|nr:serine hydrolase domain-containing protein [Nocardia inohanensis]